MAAGRTTKPPVRLTTQVIAEAERCARVGLTDTEIITHLGCSERAFYKWAETGRAHQAAIERHTDDPTTPLPRLTATTTLCVQFVQALTRARARVYVEVTDTALQVALGGGEAVDRHVERRRVEGKLVVVSERTVTRTRDPNPRMLEFLLARRWRHAWGPDAVIQEPDAGAPRGGEDVRREIDALLDEIHEHAMERARAEVTGGDHPTADG